MTSLWSQIRVLHTADPAFPANRLDTLQEGHIVLHKLLPPFMMVRERSQRERERSYHGEKVRVKITHKYQSGREDTMGHLSSLRHDFGNLHEWEREILNCWLALPRRIQEFTSVFLGKDNGREKCEGYVRPFLIMQKKKKEAFVEVPMKRTSVKLPPIHSH